MNTRLRFVTLGGAEFELARGRGLGSSGGRELPPEEGWARFSSAALDRHALRTFLHEAELSGVPLWRTADDEVLERVRLALFRREIAVRPLQRQLESGPKAREVVSAVAKLHPNDLVLGSSRYRLSASSLGRPLSGMDRYEVVPDSEAARILAQIARETSSSELAKSLKAAVEILSSPRSSRTGQLVLLRWRMQGIFNATAVGLPITPSQLKELLESKPPTETLDWIEFEIANDDGSPYTGKVEVSLTDGRKLVLAADNGAALSFSKIPPGPCRIRLLERQRRTR